MITSKKVKKEVYDTVYVTEDGKEFSTYREAQKHEDSLLAERGIPWIRTEFINTLDNSCDCFNIRSEEDLRYLQAKEWNHKGSYSYDGPGWYLAQRYDGGDYDDYYEITKVDEYIEMLEADLKQFKNLTKS